MQSCTNHIVCDKNKIKKNNIRNKIIDFETMEDIYTTREIADVGNLKHVVIDEKMNENIFSPIQYIQQYPDTVTITTSEGMYEVEKKKVQHIIDNLDPMANLDKHDMFLLSNTFLQKHGIQDV
jgi:hypothetical protein